MHHNYGVISGSHACRDRMWRRPIILDAELHTTCPGERVLVTISFNLTQNRRQKVVNRVVLCLCRGLYVRAGGLTFKFDKIPPNCSASCFSMRGLGVCLWG